MKVTIVIPVYADWTSLEVCLDSLKKYLAPEHSVLLVNDIGPEADILEKNILSAIDGLDNYRYERNPKNLGFSGTCNRAVFELDKTDNDILLLNSDTAVTEGFLEEMLEVLYMTEKHGAVVPRSNAATIYTVPFIKDSSKDLTPEESYKVFTKVKELLPRYNVMPTGVGFALLIKRNIIRQYGLFDEIFNPGYDEENDFCMRISQLGFSIVSANRAFVYHYESKSFGSGKSKLQEEHEKILLERYPFYPDTVRFYQNYLINPVEYYSDLIGELYPKKRVLLDLFEVPSAYNGTAKFGLAFIESFIRLYGDKYDISILINKEADEFHKLSKKYANVLHPDTINGTFDIAYVPSQFFHREHLQIVFRHCLRYVFCMQDIIALRCQYLSVNDSMKYNLFRQSIKYADGIVFISKFSEEDSVDFFPREYALNPDMIRSVIYHGRFRDNELPSDDSVKLPFEKYIVVMGNQYKHKNLQNTLPAMKASKHNFVIIGNPYDGKVADNIYGYSSGYLSDEFIRTIFKNCSALLFPSEYEGFGLPILTAVDYVKGIVLKDNSLNRELKEAFDPNSEYIYPFRESSEIEALLDKAVSNKLEKTPDEICNRSWDDVASDVECVLTDTLNAPINTTRLFDRWETASAASPASSRPLPQKMKSLGLNKNLVRLIKKCPPLYKFLNKIKKRIVS